MAQIGSGTTRGCCIWKPVRSQSCFSSATCAAISHCLSVFRLQTHLFVHFLAFLPLFFQSVKNNTWTSALHSSYEALESSELHGTTMGYCNLTRRGFRCE